jgi:cytochrome c2
MISRIALAASLALAVAACGSDNQPTSQPSDAAAAPIGAASTAPEAVASEPATSETPSATPSATPTSADSDDRKDKGKDDDKNKDEAKDAKPAGPPQAFNQCTACHSTSPGKTIIGPSLAGVYGHKAGQVPGFQFSDALKNSGMVLNEKNLDAFLANPAGKVPGTTMTFAGVKDHEQREAIIDYLKTL